ncbi:MAG: CBS domain-containing protein, partial [Candidatus Eisenbacteria bacterium]|nr:CBS domain-containing protein [Candidatus Eisenbacteria bacterium]
AYELAGGTVLGVAAGFGLNFALRQVRDQEKSLTFIIGAVAAVIGLARLTGVAMILSAMTLGVTVANLAPRHSKRAFETVENFAPPIYVLFFVLVGAHLDVHGMPGWMWALTLPYILGRSAGKILGANIGGRLAGAPRTVSKYLGLCLFSQGGVAVGLAILASGTFPGQIGSAIIMIVALTTFVVEVIGPPFVKLAVRKAGEVGLNVTEADLMQTLKVSDMVDRQAPAFHQATPIRTVLRTISETPAMTYPVTDTEGNLLGVITITELKESFGAEEMHDWLVAYDLIQPVADAVPENLPLEEAMTRMQERDLEYLPVVTADGREQLVGMLERRSVSRSLSKEVLHRRHLADGVATGA